MSFEISLTELAVKDLNAIKKYICNENVQAAKKVVETVLNSVEMLKENPSLGRAGRVLHTRELIIPKYPYIVPYLVRDNTIYVLRVLHTSRKWDE